MRISLFRHRCTCAMYGGSHHGPRRHFCAWGCAAHGPCWCRGAV